MSKGNSSCARDCAPELHLGGGAQSLWGLLYESSWVTAPVQWSVCRQQCMAVGGLRKGCGKPAWSGLMKDKI